MKNELIMIITGEASGDIYGAKLVKAIQKKKRDTKFCGIGSYAMKKAGVDILVDIKTLSIMGITEIFFKIPSIVHSIRHIKNAMIKLEPSLVILIDFPDFNLYIASLAKRLKIPVLYYVSPQIWAWRKYRIRKIKKLIDRIAVILPFEENLYKKYKIPVNFVGHPILDGMDNIISPSSKISNQSLANKYPVIGLFPGSRNKEVTKLLPIMIEAAKLIKKKIISAKFIVSHTNSIDSKKFNKIIKQYGKSLDILISHKSAKQIFSECNYLIATSGTVTLEAALHGVPNIIIYKLSTISYLIGKIMVNVDHIGLVNLILGRKIVPELVQWKATPKNIAEIVIPILESRDNLNKIKNKLLAIKKYLGKPGASDRVANIAINMLKNY